MRDALCDLIMLMNGDNETCGMRMKFNEQTDFCEPRIERRFRPLPQKSVYTGRRKATEI
jgi:hypothetical protein